MGKREIEEFLTHLAIDKKVSPFIIKILLNLNYRVITLSTYTPAVQSPLFLGEHTPLPFNLHFYDSK